MMKEEILLKIRESGIVAVIRADSGERAIRTSEACLAGGISAVEVTFTVPRAQDVLRDLRRRFSDTELLLGAGTVLDPETARIAILEGASYIISPCLNIETIRLCNRYRVPCMPGVMSVKEIIEAMEAGADIVKLFPGEAFGPSFIKAVKGPLPQAEIMPTGGVTIENTGSWICAGAVAVGAGGCLASGAENEDYNSITETARRFKAAVKSARAA